MPPALTLSKTDFLLYRACPKNAWLKIHKPEVYAACKPTSLFEKKLMETGNALEEEARKLFPSGKLIEGRGVEAQYLTHEYLSQHEPILFQPVFVRDGSLAAADILEYHPSTNAYSLIEVKGTSEVDKKTHIPDLAFQAVVLRKSGLRIQRMAVMHLNKAYVRRGALSRAELFTITDVTEHVEACLQDIEEQMEQAKRYLSQSDEPAGSCSCLYEGRSNHCATFAYSNPHVPAYSVHDIARIGNSKKKLTELVDRGALHLHEVPEDMVFSAIQQKQVDVHLRDAIMRDTAGIADELQKLAFPLFFLDYETFPSAIPLFDGFSPYQQIPFQYSLHVLESPQSQPKHHAFLATDAKRDPTHAFVASLAQHIDRRGSVVVWNKSFEGVVNKNIIDRLPEARVLLEDLNDRLFDLREIFQKQLYVHKEFQGGTSIKDVLPVIAPECGYQDLEIRDGGAASQSWERLTLSDASEDEKRAIIHNLERYCERDTYAMYVIWKHLDEVLRGAHA